MNWSSLIGLANDWHNYYIRTHIDALDQQQQSSWNVIIPGFLDFDFKEANQNPEIEVSFPSFDNEWAHQCSMRRTTRGCRDHDHCGDNGFCDYELSVCICNSGFQANRETGECVDCNIGEGIEYGDPVTSFDVHWDQWGFNPPPQEVTVEYMKQKVLEAINDPKWYSGPSSAAPGVAFIDLHYTADYFHTFGVDADWATEPMTDIFQDENAPHLALVDGGALDNCGLIGLVKRMQQDRDPTEIDTTIVGMCNVETMAMLITNMGDLQEHTRPIFELVGEGASVSWQGQITEVWAFHVRTLYDPLNGVLPGSLFTIWGFDTPANTPRGGVCANWGGGGWVADGVSCVGNHLRHPNAYEPQMSLMPGRGEALE